MKVKVHKTAHQRLNGEWHTFQAGKVYEEHPALSLAVQVGKTSVEPVELPVEEKPRKSEKKTLSAPRKASRKASR